MAKFRINILGCGSATPSLRHMPSSQVIDFRDRLMMIDCGEGAQLQMRRMGLKFSRLSHIFISHLHGDHCLGLPGLLSTMALHEKGGTLTVHTFAEGAEMFRKMFGFFCGDMSYDVKFNVISPAGGEIILEDDALTVETVRLYHRVPAVGFVFREKPKLRHIRSEMTQFYGVPHYAYQSLREGSDYEAADGRIVPNEVLTLPADPSVSYAYCSDTMADPRVAKAVKGVHTIYHEATYGDDNADKAVARGHSTARQAAQVALEAGARQLIIGHYSKRYIDSAPLLAEAREVFANTLAADEKMKIDLIR